MKNKKLNLLFVCRYNRFRSRVAEAYFKKINKNKNIQVKSAGLIKGNPLNPNSVKVAKEFGLNINGKTRGLSSELMAWQNVVVITADDVPEQVFEKNKSYGKRVINLKIKDIKISKKKKIEEVVRKIIRKVDKLNKNIINGRIK